MHEYYMRLCIEEARAAQKENEVPVGCVIVYENKIIAKTHNLCHALKDPTAHAELLAIREALQFLGKGTLSGCTLYVSLEPCAMCAGAIVNSRVSRLIYGAHDPACGCAGSVYRITEDPAFVHFCKSDGGILEEECAELLKTFFAERRTIAASRTRRENE